MDGEWVRFTAGLAVAALTGAWGSYAAGRRGVTKALQEHGTRLTVLETRQETMRGDIGRLEEAVWPIHRTGGGAEVR